MEPTPENTSSKAHDAVPAAEDPIAVTSTAQATATASAAVDGDDLDPDVAKKRAELRGGIAGFEPPTFNSIRIASGPSTYSSRVSAAMGPFRLTKRKAKVQIGGAA